MSSRIRREWEGFRERWAGRARLVSLLWRSAPRSAIALGLGAVGLAAPGPLTPLALGGLVHSVAAAAAKAPGASDEAVAWLALLAAAQLGQQVGRAALDAGAAAVGVAVEDRMREEIAALVGRPPTIDHLEDAGVQNCITATQRYYSPGLAVGTLPTLISIRLSALASVALLGWAWSWPAALILAAAWLGARRPFGRFFIETLAATTGQVEGLRRADYLRGLFSRPDPVAKEIRVFGLSDWLIGRFAKGSRQNKCARQATRSSLTGRVPDQHRS